MSSSTFKAYRAHCKTGTESACTFCTLKYNDVLEARYVCKRILLSTTVFDHHGTSSRVLPLQSKALLQLTGTLSSLQEDQHKPCLSFPCPLSLLLAVQPMNAHTSYKSFQQTMSGLFERGLWPYCQPAVAFEGKLRGSLITVH